MLGRGDGRLLDLTVMLGSQLLRSHRLDPRVGHAVAETPVVLRADETLAGPLVVAPPHIPECEEVLHFIGIVVSSVLVGGTSSVGVVDRIRVVEKERLPVPVEPQVRILVLLVDPFVELLDNVDHLSVERPETELRGVVALLPHLLHRGEKHLPFVPVTHGVRDIQHKHVHSSIGEHRHILPDNPFVLTQEVAHLGLSPVIGAVLPIRIVGLETGVRIGVKNLRDISPVRSR